MSLERNLCNSILQSAFSFTKKVELVVAKVLGDKELRSRYSEVDRLPFYAFVSQNLCSVVQQVGEIQS